MEQNVESNLFELQVDHVASGYLKETARWAKFLGILGFVFCGLMLLIGIFAGSFMATAFSAGRSSVLGGTFYTIVYVALALLYFFPCLYTYNFGSRMQTALRSNDQDSLNNALKNLKSCYRFVGILAIVSIGLWVLLVIIAVIGGAAANR